jgi:hypothetical protein
MRFAVVAMIFWGLACDSGQAKQPGRDDKSSVDELVPKRCLALEPFLAKQAATDEVDRVSYEAALAKRGLAPLWLQGTEEVVGDGLRAQALVHQPELTVVSRPRGTYVVGVTYWSSNGLPWPEPEFVVDELRRVFALERKRTAIATTIARCGCEPFKCGSPCSACGDTRRVLYGPIPPDATFAGKLPLEYAGASLSITFETGVCPPEPCPP